MSYQIGIKSLRRLCQEQDSVAWQKAKLSPALFTESEQAMYAWVAHHVHLTHGLPQLETLEAQFPAIVGLTTPEPASYYLDLLEKAYFHRELDTANQDSQAILKADQFNYKAAAERIQKALNNIKMQEYRLRIAEVGKDAPTLLLKQYHGMGDTVAKAAFGWPYMDKQAGGAIGGDVISFVGRPAAGKTFKLLWSAVHNWKGLKLNVLVVSMEMMVNPILQRVGALYAGVPLTQLKTSSFATGTYHKFKSSLMALAQEQGKFYVVDGNLAASVDDIYTLAYQLEVDVIYIDGGYLVKHANPRLDRFTRVAENVELMKRNTTDLSIPTFASWQFAKTASQQQATGKKKEASLDDIGYSDAIGQVSSIVLGLFQDDGVETMKQRTIRCLKGRSGEVGQFSIAWDFMNMDFTQLDPPVDGGAVEGAELDYL